MVYLCIILYYNILLRECKKIDRINKNNYLLSKGIRKFEVEELIKFINVSKEYENGVKALQNVRLHIAKGEFVFLVGASGAGKSTIIKLLLKEVEPTQGKIILDKKDITKVKNRKIPYIRRNIGVVFQDFRLLPNKTVYENVAFAMEIVGADPKEIRRRVPMVLGIVNLSKKATRFPDQLSGGEHQRVAIARAIVNNPPILIADEPTGNLDPETASGIMEALSDINGGGTTVLMVTHAKEIVDTMKKRVIEIHEGKIIRDEEKGEYGNETPNY